MKKVWVLLLTAAMAGIVFGFVTLGHHLGLTEDCLRYLSMAKHAAAGKGFSIYNPSIGPTSLPYISQAPLWSALIAAGLAIGMTPEFWTWLCAITLFGITLFLAGLTALYGTKRLSAGLAAQFVILSDLHILTHHAYALSEPLFLVLIQAAVLSLWLYLDTGGRRWLAAAIIGVGLIVLTRFIGLTYAAGLLLSILFFDKGKVGRRLPLGIFCGVLGGLPLGLWFARHFLLRHEWYGMHIAESQPHRFFPVEVAASFCAQALRYSVANGWLPDRPASTWIIPALLVSGALFFFRQVRVNLKIRGALLLILFPAVYAVGLVAATTARSVPSCADMWRQSTPMFIHLWVFLVIFLSQAIGGHLLSSGSSKPRMILSRAALVLLLFWGISLVPKTYNWMTRAITTGDYGRDDSISWAAANRIAWFPPT